MLINELREVLSKTIVLEAKNTHMEHIEDLIFNSGYEGAESALDYIRQVVSMLSTGAGNVATVTTKWDGCIHEDTLLPTTHGNITIKELIAIHQSGKQCRIEGFDFELNQESQTEITNSVISDGHKSWVEIELENGHLMILTEDHEVYTTNRGWVAAGNLTEQDDIKEPNKIE